MGSPRTPGGGGGSVFLFIVPGGGLQDGRGQGAGKVSALNRGIFLGGGKYFLLDFPCLIGISGVLGFGSQTRHLSLSTPKMVLSTMMNHI